MSLHVTLPFLGRFQNSRWRGTLNNLGLPGGSRCEQRSQSLSVRRLLGPGAQTVAPVQFSLGTVTVPSLSQNF